MVKNMKGKDGEIQMSVDREQVSNFNEDQTNKIIELVNNIEKQLIM